MRKAYYHPLTEKEKENWEKKKGEEWEKNASFWIKIIREKLDPFREEVTNEAVLKAIRSDKGNKILDAGCGEGYFCRILSQKGFKNVFGIDSSEELIQAAKELEERQRLGIKYKEEDFRDTGFPDSFFDTVVAYQTIHEIPNPQQAFKEFHRILKKGGRMILLFLHPCFDIAPREKDKDYLVSLLYFSALKIEKKCYCVGGIESPSPYFYLHLPLSKWLDLIKKQGFSLQFIKEPRPSLETIKEDDWWRKSFGKPRIILMSAKKD